MLNAIFNTQNIKLAVGSSFVVSILLVIAMAVVAIFDLPEMKGAWVFPLLFINIIALVTSSILWIGTKRLENKRLLEEIK